MTLLDILNFTGLRHSDVCTLAWDIKQVSDGSGVSSKLYQRCTMAKIRLWVYCYALKERKQLASTPLPE